jgi:3-hydroxymyristoyl/3-hydroxydecanoyl-(acyl carrier protein) dehydratase
MNPVLSLWQVPADHPAFSGHFPGRPIVPGVVLLDHALVLVQGQGPSPASGGWRVAQAKFLSPVGPGETLAFQLTPDQQGGWRFAVRSGERDVASGSFQPVAA